MKTIEEVEAIIAVYTNKLNSDIPPEIRSLCFEIPYLADLRDQRGYWRGYLDCLRESQEGKK